MCMGLVSSSMFAKEHESYNGREINTRVGKKTVPCRPCCNLLYQDVGYTIAQYRMISGVSSFTRSASPITYENEQRPDCIHSKNNFNLPCVKTSLQPH